MWTIGREREKLHAAKFVREIDQRDLLFPVIDAVHNLKEKTGGAQEFVDIAQSAMIKGGSGVWRNTTNWIRRIGKEYSVVCIIWDVLAKHKSWRIRWRVACCLYLDIGETQSNYLFAKLRCDPSKTVRDRAIARYEYRPDERGEIEKRFDAKDFEWPVDGA